MDRLRFYGAIADFVKIDGKAVRHSLEKNTDPLTLLMLAIKSAAPQAEIIAEWVENKKEAKLLKQNFGVHSVQGQNYAPVKKSQPLLPAPAALPVLQYAQ
jgi:EAL domain-containing protein (putative c-di-GMP-specific phosphodiesterase class I)